MTVMDDWVTAACAELDLDPAQVPVPTVLDLARDVAHQVLRPGAPVSAYLLGVAVGSRRAPPARPRGRLAAAERRPRPADAGRWSPAGGAARAVETARARRCPIPVRADSTPGGVGRVTLTDGGDHDGRPPLDADR